MPTRPSARSAPKTATTFGCRTRASRRPSSMAGDPRCSVVCSRSSLSATSRSRRGSHARYTSPKLPRPTLSSTTRGPQRTVSDVRASPVTWLRADVRRVCSDRPVNAAARACTSRCPRTTRSTRCRAATDTLDPDGSGVPGVEAAPESKDQSTGSPSAMASTAASTPGSGGWGASGMGGRRSSPVETPQRDGSNGDHSPFMSAASLARARATAIRAASADGRPVAEASS